jgi:hypothetical protein
MIAEELFVYPLQEKLLPNGKELTVCYSKIVFGYGDIATGSRPGTAQGSQGDDVQAGYDASLSWDVADCIFLEEGMSAAADSNAYSALVQEIYSHLSVVRSRRSRVNTLLTGKSTTRRKKKTICRLPRRS